MKISSIIKTGLISGLLSSSISCSKAPLYKLPTQNVNSNITNKLDSISKDSQKILQDKSYHFYGRDTLEITKNILTDTKDFMKDITKKAVKNTPKTKTGQHLENQMLPKTGGGFDIIPVMKTDYTPNYKNQKVVIRNVEIYSRTGKDLYIPVEYYGQSNL